MRTSAVHGWTSMPPQNFAAATTCNVNLFERVSVDRAAFSGRTLDVRRDTNQRPCPKERSISFRHNLSRP